MAPLGGIEPRTVHPALRTGLEDLCWGKGYNVVGLVGFEPTINKL